MTRQVNTHQLMMRLLDIQQWELRRAFCEADELQEAERELERAQHRLAELLRGGAGEQADLPAIVFAPALTQPPAESERELVILQAAREWYAADLELDAAEAELRTPPKPGELRTNGRFGAAQRRKWAADDALRAALKSTEPAEAIPERWQDITFKLPTALVPEFMATAERHGSPTSLVRAALATYAAIQKGDLLTTWADMPPERGLEGLVTQWEQQQAKLDESGSWDYGAYGVCAAQLRAALTPQP